jgi:hypothetical protein
MSRLTALLIGNADYLHAGKLVNPPNDARDLARVLEERGFETKVCVDASTADMDDAITDFTQNVTDGEVALFFFAGHGVQIDGGNYLLGVDTEVTRPSVIKSRAIALDQIIDDMKGANTATNLLILDACRNNPWATGGRGMERGLAPVYAPKGTLIAFSTSPGETASDGTGGKNGAYTSALLQHIGTADLTIEAMFKRVRNTLDVTSGGGQTSWEHTSLSGEFYFHLGVTDRIGEYGATALKDSIFVPDTSVWVHDIIRGLKVLSWSAQNAAMAKFDVAKAEASDIDGLFVLGRNILQAADGTAHDAAVFIRNFMARTAGLSAAKRKAILDGILFEIFFDSQGELRQDHKVRAFNDVFALQAYPDTAESFAFITDALSTYASRFYVVPGKGLGMAVDVRLLADPAQAIDKVFHAGQNLLRAEDEDYATGDRMYRARAKETFEEELSRQLLVPSGLLTITYDPPLSAGVPIRYPLGHTVQRDAT